MWWLALILVVLSPFALWSVYRAYRRGDLSGDWALIVFLLDVGIALSAAKDVLKGLA